MRLIHRTLDRVDVPRVPVKVSADFRFALLTGLGAIACLIANGQGDPSKHAPTNDRILAYATAAGFLVLGVLAVRSVASQVGRVIAGRTGPGHGGILRWLILFVGYLLILLTTLDIISVPVIHQILLGGALTGIVLGIAAQQSLGNFFAGVVLLVARPFNVGDRIRLKSGSLGGELIGDVTGMGLTYVTLATADGPLSLPNSGVLAAGIGPATDRPADDEPEPEPPAAVLTSASASAPR